MSAFRHDIDSLQYFVSGLGYGKTATNQRMHEEWLERVTRLQKGDRSVIEDKKQTAREWARKHYISYPCYIQGNNDGEVKAFSLEDFLDEYDRRKEEESYNSFTGYHTKFLTGDKYWLVNIRSIACYKVNKIEIRNNRVFIDSRQVEVCHKTFDEAVAHYKKEYGDE